MLARSFNGSIMMQILVMTYTIVKFNDCDCHNDESTKYFDITIRNATLRATSGDYRSCMTSRIVASLLLFVKTCATGNRYSLSVKSRYESSYQGTLCSRRYNNRNR